MVEREKSPVAWARLVYELDDAREHTERLVAQMAERGYVDEAEFRVMLGHIYAHLNRAWNGRAFEADPSTAEWSHHSAFPYDIDPG